MARACTERRQRPGSGAAAFAASDDEARKARAIEDGRRLTTSLLETVRVTNADRKRKLGFASMRYER
ncbi:uncharacterized protein DS421_10g293160 [Arachis hypogaea]|nr:uncharacterized protein DS421_10g293160 [Arachis hypogaea]